MDPQIKSVLGALPSDRHERSVVRGLVLFAVCVCVWAVSLSMILLGPPWLSVIACVVNGFSISMLFIVGHDACHGSLVRSRRLNRIIGTVAFLPALHPFSSWKKTHNGMHHVWTNLKQEDPGYAPLSFEDYQQLPMARRLMERLYRTRTTIGLGLFYFVEIWWKYQMFPRRDHRPACGREFLLDRLLVTTFFLTQCAAIYLMVLMTGRSAPLLFTLVAIVVPYGVFFALMGFVTFQHHTHPDIPWFDHRDEWSYFQSQVKGTTHIQFPRIFDVVLLNILEHSAHHVDPLIPLYRLKPSQLALETAFPDSMKIISWTPRVLWQTLSCCKLYDYKMHRWLDFNGNPTTPLQSVMVAEQVVSATN